MEQCLLHMALLRFLCAPSLNTDIFGCLSETGLELILLPPPPECVCIWNQTQGFVHTRQALCLLSHTPSANSYLLSGFSEPLAKG